MYTDDDWEKAAVEHCTKVILETLGPDYVIGSDPAREEAAFEAVIRALDESDPYLPFGVIVTVSDAGDTVCFGPQAALDAIQREVDALHRTMHSATP